MLTLVRASRHEIRSRLAEELSNALNRNHNKAIKIVGASPRILASLESLQRLVVARGGDAVFMPEWDTNVDIILCQGLRSFEDFLPIKLLHQLPDLAASIEVDDAQGGLPLAVRGKHFNIQDQNSAPANLSAADHFRWNTSLAGALNLLSLDNDSISFVRRFVKLLVPLQDQDNGRLSSISFNNFPFTVFSSFHSELMLVETLVHEADHQRLYLISRYEDFQLESHETDSRRTFRSPWRDDPRPLDGLLWGASAFARVSKMWATLARRAGSLEQQNLWIKERAVLCNYQSIDALRTLQSHSQPNEPAAALINDLSKQAVRTRGALMKLDDFDHFLRKAEEVQKQHDYLWSKRNSEIDFISHLCSADYYIQFENAQD